MNTENKSAVKYFYSYFQKDSNNDTENFGADFGLFTPKIIEKLPKIQLNLPQISICDNFELSFC